MSKLTWDAVGERYYETGNKKGVLFVYDSEKKTYGAGVAWSGLTAVTESPSGAEATPLYADDIKYLNLMSAEEFGCTIEAYTYPDEFKACDGYAELGTGVTIGQQKRSTFAFSYVTTLGNDVDNNDYGYKIHIVYGCLASPSEKSYATINDSPEAITFSWEIATTPIEVEGHKPTATITIDSTKVTKEQLAAIEAKLYGTESEESTLLMPADIVEILTPAAG
jgi:hypothetical protein